MGWYELMPETRRQLAMLLIFPWWMSIAGCQALEGYLESAPRPSASIVGVHLDNLRLDSATFVFDVRVDNPYATALPLTNLDYSLASGGKPFLEGQAPVEGLIPAKDSKVVSLPARLDFARLISAVENIRPGDVVPYTAKMKLSVDAPAVGKLALPLSKSGKVPVPTVPNIELAEIQWSGFDLNRTEAVLRLNITNTNRFPVDLNRLGLNLALAGHTIASTGVEPATHFEPQGQATLDVPIRFSPRQLGASVIQLIQGKSADYRIMGNLGTGTPFGPMEVPYEKAGNVGFKAR